MERVTRAHGTRDTVIARVVTGTRCMYVRVLGHVLYVCVSSPGRTLPTYLAPTYLGNRKLGQERWVTTIHLVEEEFEKK